MKKRVSEELKTVNEESILVPTFTQDLEGVAGESILLFGKAKKGRKVYRLFYGLGVVYRVVKGERNDLIYINFGLFSNLNTRLVVAYDNIARRQVLTLKRGHVCQVWGVCSYYNTEFQTKDGEKRKRLRLGLFAKGIIDWYVPTMMDTRKMPTNEDIEQPTDKEEALQEIFDDILDEFMNGKETEE